jgi:hypothetical protein
VEEIARGDCDGQLKEMRSLEGQPLRERYNARDIEA